MGKACGRAPFPKQGSDRERPGVLDDNNATNISINGYTTNTYIYIYICAYAHIYTCMYVCIYIYICTCI